jgi:DNA-binding transcriptional LysR family regulator
MQDLNDMVFFAEVVDRGGFAAAGRALNLPKSKLSRRVAELEQRLGVRLLQRTTRKLSLTAAGEQFHKHAVAMREQAEAAEEAVAIVQSEPRGTIHVTCPITLAQTTISPLIPAFLREHPLVRVEMQLTNRVVDVVKEGVDVALRVRPSLDDSGSLVVKKLAESQGLMVIAPSLFAQYAHPDSIEALARIPAVTMSAVDGKAIWYLRGPRDEEAAVHVKPGYTADDLLSLKFAVLAGTGMSLLPDYMVRRELREGTLVEVCPEWRPRPGIIHAVFASRRGMVPAVRRFLDYLGEHVTAEGQDCPV